MESLRFKVYQCSLEIRRKILGCFLEEKREQNEEVAHVRGEGKLDSRTMLVYSASEVVLVVRVYHRYLAFIVYESMGWIEECLILINDMGEEWTSLVGTIVIFSCLPISLHILLHLAVIGRGIVEIVAVP